MAWWPHEEARALKSGLVACGARRSCGDPAWTHARRPRPGRWFVEYRVVGSDRADHPRSPTGAEPPREAPDATSGTVTAGESAFGRLVERASSSRAGQKQQRDFGFRCLATGFQPFGARACPVDTTVSGAGSRGSFDVEPTSGWSSPCSCPPVRTSRRECVTRGPDRSRDRGARPPRARPSNIPTVPTMPTTGPGRGGSGDVGGPVVLHQLLPARRYAAGITAHGGTSAWKASAPARATVTPVDTRFHRKSNCLNGE